MSTVPSGNNPQLQPKSDTTRAASATSSTSTTPASSTVPNKKKRKGKKRKSVDTQLRHEISIALICQSNLNRSMEAHWVLQEKGGFASYSFGAGSKVRLPGETIDRPHVYEFGTTYDSMYKDLERKNRSRYTKNGMLQMLDRDRQLKEAPERWQDHYDRYQQEHYAAIQAQTATHKKRKNADGTITASSSSSSSLTGEPPKPKHFDLVITFEKRVYDIVQADIETRGANPAVSANLPTHLINIDTTDNHAEAAVSAQLTLELVQGIYKYVKRNSNSNDQEDDGDAEEQKDDSITDDADDDVDDADDDSSVGDDEDWMDKMDTIIDEFETKHGKEVGHTVLFY